MKLDSRHQLSLPLQIPRMALVEQNTICALLPTWGQFFIKLAQLLGPLPNYLIAFSDKEIGNQQMWDFHRMV